MFGKYITLYNDSQEITVFVFGIFNLSNKEWEKRAKKLISNMSMGRK